MGKLDFISILCLSLALLANPLIGMQYCTVHHHFLEKLDEIHFHAEHHATWHASVCESCHDATLSRSDKMVFPAVGICLIVLSFNLLGDGLRDAFDPKLRK